MCWETVKYQGKSELVKARFNFLIVVRCTYWKKYIETETRSYPKVLLINSYLTLLQQLECFMH